MFNPHQKVMYNMSDLSATEWVQFARLHMNDELVLEINREKAVTVWIRPMQSTTNTGESATFESTQESGLTRSIPIDVMEDMIADTLRAGGFVGAVPVEESPMQDGDTGSDGVSAGES